MKSILVTGCNRGLGLGIVKHLIKRNDPPEHLIATCRNIVNAQELRKIGDEYKNVHILELDVTDFDSYKPFSEKVSQIVGENGLNVLFNNAGCSPKSTRINFVKPEQLIDTYKVNTVGPIMLTKMFVPLLRKASRLNCDKPLGVSRAAVINMSSILGSIEQCTGGLYPYRCSKAALNMATRSLSFDLKDDGILVTALHPGWVRTDLGGSNAPMDVDESTISIVELLPKLSEIHQGGYYQWDGKQLPW